MFLFQIPDNVAYIFGNKMLLFIGIALCLSIIGLPLGIPLLIIYFIAQPFIEKKSCPFCKNKILTPKYVKAFDCYICHKRILVKGTALTLQ